MEKINRGPRNDKKGFIQALPKVEMHLHLDGTLTPELIQRLAREQNYGPLAGKTLKEIAAAAVVSSSLPSLQAVLEIFNVIYPLIKQAGALETIAYELCQKAAGQRVIYFETRFAPTLCAARGFTVEQAVLAALAGLRRGHKYFGVQSGLILCLLRNLPQKENELILELAKKFKGKGVVALDLANDELAKPLTAFADYYREAKRAGLGTTVHAGEVYPAPDLKTALDLGIDRVGHAAALARYPDLLQEFARRKIPLEINLTSNLRTGAVRKIEEHPARQYFEAGIPLSFNTDDPGVFGIDLNGEYHAATEQAGFTEREIAQIALGAIQSLFLSRSDKKRLEKTFLGRASLVS